VRSIAQRIAWGLLGLLVACKIEPIEELELEEPTPIELPFIVQPSASHLADDARGAARWDEALQRHLAFAIGPELGGRRPGSPGATLAAGHVISVLQAAGLSPSGPDLGWTQAVGVRAVWTQGLSLVVHMPAPASGSAPPPRRFDEGLWLQRHGSAGTETLRLRIDGQAERPPQDAPVDPSVDPLPQQRLRLLDPSAVPTDTSPWVAYLEAFDSAWRDGVDVAVLPVPGEDAATLTAAERWRGPHVQSLLVGREPPAGLELRGFVGPEVHAALLAARAKPEAIVELHYEATERWFEDDNVIGRIAGGRYPEQVVLVATHWDDGGLAEPVAEGGGSDNAGSLAVLLAVAEVAGRWRSAGRRPDRSIVLLAEAAGSLGHRGIERFIEASGIRPANVVAVIVLDRLGGSDETLRVIDGDRSSLGSQITAIDPTARMHGGGLESHGHLPFLELRVPAVTLTRPAPPDLDGTIPPPSVAALRRDAELTLRLLWDLADQPEPPRWLARDEAASPPPQ
jgi:hypothetical protein